MAITTRRKFDGKVYVSSRYTPKKKVADKWAEEYRERGKSARITKQRFPFEGKLTTVYVVWVR